MDVKDGLRALQALAAHHRAKFKIPVIGVTGSAGKTTTKDMIASVLSAKFPTLKNEANQNNEIGVPLTLLKLTRKHRAAVIEMGMQGRGEIELLARIARPTIAVVTNIGEAHLEFLKTRKNIARAKAEIFTFLKKGDQVVINQDDEYYEHLRSRTTNHDSRTTTFGILEKADITPRELNGIELPLPGEHNIYNSLAAIAVARILRLNRAQIKRGLEKFHPSGNRMEVINRRNGVKIINDTYNANPQSMAAALRTLAALSGRKIAVLGEMYELGKAAGPAHRRVSQLARRLKIDQIYTYGPLWPSPNNNYLDKTKLIKYLRKIIRPRDIILCKGSRGTRMEEVVDALR